MSFWRIFPTPGHAAPLRPSPLLSPTLGPPIPIVYGQAYVPGRIVYVDSKPTFAVGAFWSIDHSRWEGALGLTVSKAVFVFCEAPVTSLGVALCNGRPVDISDGLGKFCAWSSIGVSVIGGISPEIIAGATSSIFATTGQGYEGTAHWRAPFLHRDGGIPQIQWKVSGACVRGGETYAHPADVLVDLLTNTRYGLGLTALTIVTTLGIDGLASSSFETYCNATGIRVNRALTEQESAKDSIEALLADTNSVAIWSEGKLKIIPMDWRSKGAYHPPTSAVVLDEDEILLDGGRDPVTMLRTPDSDVFNHWPVRSKTADDNFAENVYGLPDALNVQVHGGIRTAPTTDSKWLATRQMVADYSAFLLSRSLHVRNRYRFRVGPRWCLLEPMDLITITDTHLGLDNEPCRIVTIEEQDDGSFLLEADEYPGSVRPVDMTPQPYDGAGNTNQGSGGGSGDTPRSTQAAGNYALTAFGFTGQMRAVARAPATEPGGVRMIVATGVSSTPTVVVMRSIDDGATWTNATTAPPTSFMPYGILSYQVGVATEFVAFGNGSGSVKAYYSGDGAVNFSACSLPADSGGIYGGTSDATYLYLIGYAGSTTPRLYRATDPSSTWTSLGANLPAGSWRAVAFDELSTLLAVGEHGECAISTNSGSAWTGKTTLPGTSVAVVDVQYAPLEGAFVASGSSLVGGVSKATIWKSQDAGATWSSFVGPSGTMPINNVAGRYLSIDGNSYVMLLQQAGATTNSIAVSLNGEGGWLVLDQDPVFSPVCVTLADTSPAGRRLLYVGHKPPAGVSATAWFARTDRF